LGKLILKHFLLLVLLLDTVNTQVQLPRHAPLLFRIDSPIKSSADIVRSFLHQRLHGEGNVLRHLDLLGYRLGYQQSPLTEYPFAITNLAVDLRDGLRLCRLVELLTGGAHQLGLRVGMESRAS
jgi:abnormal spindle-like microcephaly-associated protein